MKQIIVYIKRGQDYKVIKCDNLRIGHEVFNAERNKEFDYIELGIDTIDIDCTYRIVRCLHGIKEGE